MTIEQKIRDTETVDAIISWMREYAKTRINSLLIDERRCIPPYIVLDFGNHGILGMEIPREFDGLGLSTKDSMRITQQLAAIDMTLASFVGVNNALGIRPILKYAKPSIRNEFLPQLAKGRILAALAYTEPNAGSYIRNIQTTGRRLSEDRWIIEGKKIWIGSAAWSELINVFVKIPMPDKTEQIAAFVIPQGTSGLEMGKEALTMGLRGMIQNEVLLNDVQISDEYMLGAIHQGLEVAEDAMNCGRVGITAMAIGVMKRSLQLMLRFASKRKIATGLLIENSLLKERLHDAIATIYCIECLLDETVDLLDSQIPIPPELSSAGKVLASEACWRLIDLAMQTLGGRGYIETNQVTQMLRDARILRIFEGTTEVLTCYSGALVYHGKSSALKFLRERMNAADIADQIQDSALFLKSKAKEALASISIESSYHRMGEICFYGLMLAASRQNSARNTAQTKSLSSIDWATDQFKSKVQQAKTEPIIPAIKDLEYAIEGYSDSIGDLRQNPPDVDYDLDDYLS